MTRDHKKKGSRWIDFSGFHSQALGLKHNSVLHLKVLKTLIHQERMVIWGLGITCGAPLDSDRAKEPRSKKGIKPKLKWCVPQGSLCVLLATDSSLTEPRLHGLKLEEQGSGVRGGITALGNNTRGLRTTTPHRRRMGFLSFGQNGWGLHWKIRKKVLLLILVNRPTNFYAELPFHPS